MNKRARARKQLTKTTKKLPICVRVIIGGTNADSKDTQVQLQLHVTIMKGYWNKCFDVINPSNTQSATEGIFRLDEGATIELILL